MKTTIEFNLNDYVYVQLTESGINELRRQHRDDRIPHKFIPPKTDKDGWSKWQLHDLMERFGHLSNLGFTSPFNTTIRLEKTDDNL